MISHRLCTRTDLPANARSRELYPIAACACGFQGIKKKIIGGDDAISWNFERGFGFAVSAGEKDVHHARTCAASEETFHSRRHDFSLGLAWFIRRHQGPEAVQDDLHGVAHFDQFLFALYGAYHVECRVEGNQFEGSFSQLAVITNGHHKIHAVDSEAFPLFFGASFGEPVTGHIRPNLIFDPGLGFIAYPTRFPRKYERRFAIQGNQNVNVSMYDFKPGNIENCTFEAGVLVAANDESVQVFTLHGITDILESPIDFCLAWQRLPPKIRSLYADFEG